MYFQGGQNRNLEGISQPKVVHFRNSLPKGLESVHLTLTHTARATHYLVSSSITVSLALGENQAYHARHLVRSSCVLAMLPGCPHACHADAAAGVCIRGNITPARAGAQAPLQVSYSAVHARKPDARCRTWNAAIMQDACDL